MSLLRSTFSSTLGRWARIPATRGIPCAQRRLLTQGPDGSAQSAASSSTPASGTALDKLIDDSIKITGPLSVAHYMHLCLTHPTHGYYTQGDVFGRKGDFITSPEISQVFGELVAIWLLTRWIAAGSPARCRLIELGPGRGTLMDDVLRTFQALKKPLVETVQLVETSKNMRKVQLNTLESRTNAMGTQLVWSDSVDEIPESDAFTMVIAHEFFDAMPIAIVQRTEEGFREIKVARNPAFVEPESESEVAAESSSEPRFHLAVDRESSMFATLLSTSSPRFKDLPVGARVEVSPESARIVRKLGQIMENGGAGLVVDYGGDRAYDNSFRAFRKHKIVDIFDEPGSSDLTANVDFAYLKEALDGIATPLGPISQANFLLALGLEPRLSKLLSAAANDPEKQKRIRDAVQRLIDPVEMGRQYQVMAIVKGAAGEGDVYPFPPAVERASASAEQPGATDDQRK